MSDRTQEQSLLMIDQSQERERMCTEEKGSRTQEDGMKAVGRVQRTGRDHKDHHPSSTASKYRADLISRAWMPFCLDRS